MIVVGLMSGTSVDAIDVAAARFTLAGDTLSMDLLGHREMAWPETTRRRILAALPPAQVSMGEVCALDVLIGEAFAEAAALALREIGPADLVCSHGQTLFHWVEDGRVLGTLQLGQPAVIAERTGLPVVSDLRARDVAAGGQGAPLASTLDSLWLAGPERRAALNLGGIANVTLVGGDAPVLAFDTGPASCLLDLEAARISGGVLSCDLDGLLAASGSCREDLLSRLLADPYFARPAPKSTGRELFDGAYLAARLAGLPPVSNGDLMATLTEFTARTVAEAVRAEHVTEVVVSGGGTRNPSLMRALTRALGHARLITSDERGLPGKAKEAYLFALLGFLSWHGLAGNTTATGAAGARILGRISPGVGHLRLPSPQEPPRRLIITTGAAS